MLGLKAVTLNRDNLYLFLQRNKLSLLSRYKEFYGESDDSGHFVTLNRDIYNINAAACIFLVELNSLQSCEINCHKNLKKMYVRFIVIWTIYKHLKFTCTGNYSPKH